MALVIFILIIAILILVHELGHFLAARRNKIGVDEFAIGFPPRLWSKKIKGTRYSLNAIPLGGYVKLHGEDRAIDDKSFIKKSIWARFKVISAGVLMNIILAYVLLIIYFAFSGSPLATDPAKYPDFIKSKITQTVITNVLDDSSAKKMGLKVGDIILDVNGQKISDANTFSNYTASQKNKPIILKIEREKEAKTIQGEVGEREDKGSLGVEIANYYPNIVFKWWAIPLMSVIDLFNIIFITLYFFWNLILVLFNQAKPLGEVVGPVGVYFVAKQAVALGFSYVLRLMILLSVNLAVINFLPIPALDGGRALFLLIEKIRGKKMKEETESLVHLIGFLILIVLIIFISVRDVLKLF
ncbi:MAG: M50 family metallopeptidase [Patescibacteria group bacterium]|nr:M50 family metallopeptidase [Patescibacteria group bacterium]